MKKTAYLSFVLVGIMLLSKSVFADHVVPANPQDPYENYNRHAFRMNETLDKNFLKPVAQAFNALPYPVPQGVRHFFNNLAEIPTIVNDVLQGEFLHATSDTWRFAVNSTLGVGGFFDVASKMQLAPHSNDFGITLARWGYASSAYFILPVLGPSTIRDSIGVIPDQNMFSVYPYISPASARYGLIALNGVSKRAEFLNFEGIVDQLAIDPYVFQRNAYLQHRRLKINDELSDVANNNVSGTYIAQSQ
jgi:phospholipid-binding lipoprotein MlaA